MLSYNIEILSQTNALACGHYVSAELPSGRLRILENQYVAFLFSTKYAKLPFSCSYINEIRTVEKI